MVHSDSDLPADLAGGEADVLVADDDLELLPAHAVGLRPQRVVLRHDLDRSGQGPGGHGNMWRLVRIMGTISMSKTMTTVTSLSSMILRSSSMTAWWL